MKTLMMLTALLLMPVGAYCETGLPGPREALLKEIEAYGAALAGVNEPRLMKIKADAFAARNEEDLTQPRLQFESWKSARTRRLYRAVIAASADTESRETFEEFRARKAEEAAFFSAKRQHAASARVASRTAPIRSLAAGAQATPSLWSRFFDGSSSSGGEAPVAATPAVNNPSRYNKVRAIMLSQGAQASIVDAAIAEALNQGVDPTLALSVIWQESRFRPGATSSSGARGLMQLMPDTGRDMGVSNSNMLYDVRTNLRAGIKYLRWVTGYLKLNVSLADITVVPVNKIKALLASYNAGIGNVAKWLRHQGQELTHIPFAETRNYVSVIGSKISSLVGSLGW